MLGGHWALRKEATSLLALTRGGSGRNIVATVRVVKRRTEAEIQGVLAPFVHHVQSPEGARVLRFDLCAIVRACTAYRRLYGFYRLCVGGYTAYIDCRWEAIWLI